MEQAKPLLHVSRETKTNENYHQLESPFYPLDRCHRSNSFAPAVRPGNSVISS
jgi:hypothetical protein